MAGFNPSSAAIVHAVMFPVEPCSLIGSSALSAPSLAALLFPSSGFYGAESRIRCRSTVTLHYRTCVTKLLPPVALSVSMFTDGWTTQSPTSSAHHIATTVHRSQPIPTRFEAIITHQRAYYGDRSFLPHGLDHVCEHFALE